MKSIWENGSFDGEGQSYKNESGIISEPWVKLMESLGKDTTTQLFLI